MKCPYCKSERIISCGYDDEAMEIWKCMSCHESFTRSDLIEVIDDDDDDDDEDAFESFLNWLVDSGIWNVGV